jgi:hypothetical protein
VSRINAFTSISYEFVPGCSYGSCTVRMWDQSINCGNSVRLSMSCVLLGIQCRLVSQVRSCRQRYIDSFLQKWPDTLTRSSATSFHSVPIVCVTHSGSESKMRLCNNDLVLTRPPPISFILRPPETSTYKRRGHLWATHIVVKRSLRMLEIGVVLLGVENSLTSA